MGKVVKNMLISFMVVFTILSIISFVFYKVRLNMFIERVIEQISKDETIVTDDEYYENAKNNFGENNPNQVLILSHTQAYSMGQDEILETQLEILGVSVIIGGAIGILISTSEKSKVREVILFAIIGLGLALVGTVLTNIMYDGINGISTDFLNRLIYDFIKPYFLAYILIYLGIYVIRYLINKNKVKQMNSELKATK